MKLLRPLVPPLLLCSVLCAPRWGAVAAAQPLEDQPLAHKGGGKDGPRDAGTVRRLKLRELWDFVERRFPGLQAARHSVTAAKYVHDEQKWLALPSGEFQTYLTWSPDIKCTDAVDNPETGEKGLNLQAGGSPVLSNGQPIGGSGQCLTTNVPPTLNSDTLNSYLPKFGALVRIDARVNQPLFTFGKLKTARDLGKVGVDLARAGETINRMETALTVVRIYYGLKTVRASLETVKEGQSQIKQWVKRIDSELEKGKGSYTEIDLMRMKVSESQVDMAVADLERTEKSLLRGLRYYVQDDHVDIDDGDLEVADKEPEPVSHYVDVALGRRPEMLQLRATGEGARLYRRLRIAELLPDLAATVNFGYGYAGGVKNEPNNAFMSRFNYVGVGAGLVLRMNLDFGPKVARLQKAQADLLQFEAKQREATTGVATEVERTYLDLEEARRRLKAADSAERRARGWYQGVKQAIDVGTAESRDMIDALRAYFDQHLTVLRTINDVNVLHATLRRQSGLDVIGE